MPRHQGIPAMFEAYGAEQNAWDDYRHPNLKRSRASKKSARAGRREPSPTAIPLIARRRKNSTSSHKIPWYQRILMCGDINARSDSRPPSSRSVHRNALHHEPRSIPLPTGVRVTNDTHKGPSRHRSKKERGADGRPSSSKLSRKHTSARNRDHAEPPILQSTPEPVPASSLPRASPSNSKAVPPSQAPPAPSGKPKRTEKQASTASRSAARPSNRPTNYGSSPEGTASPPSPSKRRGRAVGVGGRVHHEVERIDGPGDTANAPLPAGAAAEVVEDEVPVKGKKPIPLPDVDGDQRPPPNWGTDAAAPSKGKGKMTASEAAAAAAADRNLAAAGSGGGALFGEVVPGPDADATSNAITEEKAGLTGASKKKGKGKDKATISPGAATPGTS